MIPMSNRPSLLACLTTASRVSVKYLKIAFCNSTSMPNKRFKNLAIKLKSFSKL